MKKCLFLSAGLIIVILTFGVLSYKGVLAPAGVTDRAEPVSHTNPRSPSDTTGKNLLRHYPYWHTRDSHFTNLSTKADVVMLGDSITDYAEWNELLPGVRVLNRGIGGDNSSRLLERLDAVINISPGHVFIMIGINDINKGTPVTEIFTKYLRILDLIREEGITPVVQSTLYIGQVFSRVKGASPERVININEQVRKLNSLLSNYCRENNIMFLDLNSSLSENGFLKEEYAFDGLHPNGPAYLIWAGEIMRVVKHLP